MKILFICHANICRSFMAQELTKKQLPDAEVFSRGLFVDPDLQVPEKITRFLAGCDVVPAPHTPTQLSASDLERADLVFCMEPQHQEHLLDRYAQYTGKIWLLCDFACGKQKAIDDPIGLTGRAFEKQAQELKKTVLLAAERIKKEFL